MKDALKETDFDLKSHQSPVVFLFRGKHLVYVYSLVLKHELIIIIIYSVFCFFSSVCVCVCVFKCVFKTAIFWHVNRLHESRSQHCRVTNTRDPRFNEARKENAQREMSGSPLLF